MGAYGAALTACDLFDRRVMSTILDKNALQYFSHEAKPTICKACTNSCSMTINTFDFDRYIIN
jgi:hypothetical protein